MLTRGRVIGGVALVVVLGLAWVAWSGYQVQRDLRDAEAAAQELRSALEADDTAARDDAVDALAEHAGSARARTDGPVWSALTLLPVIGDDADAVRVISESLDRVTRGGVEPLTGAIDDVQGLLGDGRIDLQRVAALQQPMASAEEAFTAAEQSLNVIDTDGLVGALQGPFESLDSQVSEAAGALRGAAKATQVLPTMLGQDGARDYLLIFQNNAEVRATGGLPGSWARLHVEDGALELREQGSWPDFPVRDTSPLPLTPGEIATYSEAIGQFFANPGFTPDFPRAAELWQAHWDLKYPDIELSGVLAIDPVALGYLLEATGPVQVGDRAITAENAVEELLSRPYLEIADPAQQDVFFEQAAATVFRAVVSDAAEPVPLVEGLARATDERRLLFAPFDPAVAEQLAGTLVLGEQPGDDGAIPHVDVGLSDLTASKMSYYLRYRLDVQAAECLPDDRQRLRATLTMRQSIDPASAAELPPYVTGGGGAGGEPGAQLVAVRLYAPFGGSIDAAMIDGEKLELTEVSEIDGRQVATIVIELTSRDDLVLSADLSTGAGQDAAGQSLVTPSVVPGSGDRTFASAC
ncbi:DUF4012 domain-containing protein [Nocardioides nanhaiensis]|uniref:DUF4012 domain-containing protein n=1 Tax=Nocardioides nanhaiensis TaxID=1476871 RepID=A0ABP8VWQ6_9ACTN